jgi:hypothetical protein
VKDADLLLIESNVGHPDRNRDDPMRLKVAFDDPKAGWIHYPVETLIQTHRVGTFTGESMGRGESSA